MEKIGSRIALAVGGAVVSASALATPIDVDISLSPFSGMAVFAPSVVVAPAMLSRVHADNPTLQVGCPPGAVCPEPGTLALLALGVASLAATRRRKLN